MSWRHCRGHRCFRVVSGWRLIPAGGVWAQSRNKRWTCCRYRAATRRRPPPGPEAIGRRRLGAVRHDRCPALRPSTVRVLCCVSPPRAAPSTISRFRTATAPVRRHRPSRRCRPTASRPPTKKLWGRSEITHTVAVRIFIIRQQVSSSVVESWRTRLGPSSLICRQVFFKSLNLIVIVLFRSTFVSPGNILLGLPCTLYCPFYLQMRWGQMYTRFFCFTVTLQKCSCLL